MCSPNVLHILKNKADCRKTIKSLTQITLHVFRNLHFLSTPAVFTLRYCMFFFEFGLVLFRFGFISVWFFCFISRLYWMIAGKSRFFPFFSTTYTVTFESAASPSHVSSHLTASVVLLNALPWYCYRFFSGHFVFANLSGTTSWFSSSQKNEKKYQDRFPCSMYNQRKNVSHCDVFQSKNKCIFLW